MKSAGALGTHLAGEVTTVATCWKVTLASGPVVGFTDHDSNLVVSGITYAAATGYTRSAIQTTAELAVDNLDLEGLFDSSVLRETDLRAGLWDYATIEIFQVNWAEPGQGTLKLRKGQLGEVRAGRSAFQAELRGLMQQLQQSAGRLYGPACDADLGDTRCGITLASFTVTGSVTSVTSNRVFLDTSRTEALGYFDYGKITFTSGLNNGLSMEVKTWVLSTKTISLQLPMPYAVAAGNTYSMSAGCDKRFATCKATFNNVNNFRGFPHVPGLDQMASGGL